MPVITTYDCSTGLLTEEEVEATLVGDKDVPEPRDLQAEVDTLRESVDALRTELAQLRGE